jgi:hypothetical protein
MANPSVVTGGHDFEIRRVVANAFNTQSLRAGRGKISMPGMRNRKNAVGKNQIYINTSELNGPCGKS